MTSESHFHWRRELPSPEAVKACQWWWYRSPTTKARPMQLSWQLDRVLVSGLNFGDHEPNRLAQEWADPMAEWAPCLTPEEVSTTTVTALEAHHIGIRVSERSVYNALRNLLVNTYKIDGSSIVTELLKHFDPKRLVTDWMNGAHMREFVSRTAREAVREMAEKVLRDEVRSVVNGRVKITIGDAP